VAAELTEVTVMPSTTSDEPYPPELARLTMPDPPCGTVPYGEDPEQSGELWPGSGGACVVLLHGGFWRKQYRLDLMHALANCLWRAGYTVWNLEYRRVGCRGGWRVTFDDVAKGFDALARLAPAHGIDLERVTVVGHSAGGHLALWLAAGQRAHAVRPAHVIGLAPVTDLVLAYERGLSEHAVAELLGGNPESNPRRYRDTSPIALLPTGCRQVIVHGTADDAVPFDFSVRYTAAARRAGDDCRLVSLPGAGHIDLIDPRTAACRTVQGLLHAFIGDLR
jgi:acetyl esterase/lipase